MADLEAFTRQRIDYQRLPNGGLRAVLTVTLPDGVVRSYAADLVSGEMGATVAGGFEVGSGWWFEGKERGPLAYAGGKIAATRFRATGYDAQAFQKMMRAVMRGELKLKPGRDTDRWKSSNAQIQADARLAGLEWSRLEKKTRDFIRKKYGPPSTLDKIGKGIVSVVKVVAPLALNFVIPGSGFIASAAMIAKGLLPTAKKVLNSDLMQHAAAELAKEAGGAISPVLKTSALTAASVLGVGGQLAKAQQYADAGKTDLARILAKQAALNAQRVTSSPESAAKLLRLANEKRLAAEALAHGTSPAAAKRQRMKPKAAPKQGPDVLEAARAGGVRSNKGGAVSESELVRAARAGRVFWVHA
jgi:hypothetical protein